MSSFHDIFKMLTEGTKFDRSNNKRKKSKVCKTEQKEKTLPTVKEEIESDEASVIDELNVDLQDEVLVKDEFSLKDEFNVDLRDEVSVSDEYNFNLQDEVSRFRNINSIAVKGMDVPPPIRSFQELEVYGISKEIIANVMACGYDVPTPIQMQAIPVMISSRQILACAPTGSGKTAAFLIPILGDLKKPSRKGFRALILCPTRELAKQTFQECVRLTEKTGLKPHIITKVKQDKFGSKFSTKFDILISTPNRLIYLLKQENNVLCLDNVQWLVVDESDKLFETGKNSFREQLGEIYRSCTNENIKRAMFSATYTQQVESWCKKKLKNVVSVTIGQRNTTVKEVSQELIYVGDEQGKLLAFRDLVRSGMTPPVLIFVESKERAKELWKELLLDMIMVDVIHSDRTQLQRENTVRAFREGKIWVLICTELMGRGIDFKGVKLVVNYDFPPSAISYIHRIGRTGRAGRPGKAVTYFTLDDKPKLRSIASVMKESGCDVPNYMLEIKKTKRPGKNDPKNKDVKKRDPIMPTIRFNKRKRNSKNNSTKAKKRKISKNENNS